MSVEAKMTTTFTYKAENQKPKAAYPVFTEFSDGHSLLSITAKGCFLFHRKVTCWFMHLLPFVSSGDYNNSSTTLPSWFWSAKVSVS